MHLVPKRKRIPRYCSFCGKEEDEVFLLVSGPNVMICDECTADVQRIINERKIEMGALAVVQSVLKTK